MLKKILQFKLGFATKLILAKYKPEVIGITGSVGKTSTKEAIYAVLNGKFNVRKNIKNYNNEIGLPLTVIGVSSPGKNFFGWIGVILKIWKLLLIRDKNYPKILILEMGIDRPGDMDYLCKIVKPKIGVVTNISQSHLEYFSSLAQIQKEKLKLVKNLSVGGWAILNYNDQRTKNIAKFNKKINILTYGLDHAADIKAREDKIVNGRSGKVAGVNYKLSNKGSVVPVMIKGVIGCPMIKSSLAAAAIGIIYGLNSLEISQAFRDLKFPPGRSSLIKGVNDTTIIDDTYNASPESVKAIIATADLIKLTRNATRWAILGDMLELGSYEDEGHRQVGRAVAHSKFNKLIVVGELGIKIGKAAIRAGMRENDIVYYDNSKIVCEGIRKIIKKNDLILVKGSQGARMERIVKCLMKDSDKASELLVRQGKEWI